MKTSHFLLTLSMLLSISFVTSPFGKLKEKFKELTREKTPIEKLSAAIKDRDSKKVAALLESKDIDLTTVTTDKEGNRSNVIYEAADMISGRSTDKENKKATEVLKILLQKVNPNAVVLGRPIIVTFAKASPEVFKLLLDLEGVDVNKQDDKGYTALMMAVMDCNIDNIKSLLARGADVSLKKDVGTPFESDVIKMAKNPFADCLGNPKEQKEIIALLEAAPKK